MKRTVMYMYTGLTEVCLQETTIFYFLKSNTSVPVHLQIVHVYEYAMQNKCTSYEMCIQYINEL